MGFSGKPDFTPRVPVRPRIGALTGRRGRQPDGEASRSAHRWPVRRISNGGLPCRRPARRSPPFTRESRHPEGPPRRGRAGTAATRRRVALGYSVDSVWARRNSSTGRPAIVAFLARNRSELDYRLIKELGPLAGTASRCGSPTSGMTTAELVPLLRQRELGIRPRRSDAITASPASTTCRSPRRTGATPGRSARVRPIIPGSPTSGSEPRALRASRLGRRVPAKCDCPGSVGGRCRPGPMSLSRWRADPRAPGRNGVRACRCRRRKPSAAGARARPT